MHRLAKIIREHGCSCTIHNDYIAVDVPYIHNGIQGIEIFVARTHNEVRFVLGY